MYRIVFAVSLLLSGVAMAGTQVNLAGNWKLDYRQSTVDLTNESSNRLVISQMGDALRFDRYKDAKLISTENIIADGKSRQRYKTRLEIAYVKARWEKGGLVLVTDSMLDNEGTQSYSTTERWEVSKDGKTLSKKTSDGVLVFSREPEKPEAASPASQ